MLQPACKLRPLPTNVRPWPCAECPGPGACVLSAPPPHACPHARHARLGIGILGGGGGGAFPNCACPRLTRPQPSRSGQAQPLAARRQRPGAPEYCREAPSPAPKSPPPWFTGEGRVWGRRKGRVWAARPGRGAAARRFARCAIRAAEPPTRAALCPCPCSEYTWSEWRGWRGCRCRGAACGGTLVPAAACLHAASCCPLPADVGVLTAPPPLAHAVFVCGIFLSLFMVRARLQGVPACKQLQVQAGAPQPRAHSNSSPPPRSRARRPTALAPTMSPTRSAPPWAPRP